MKPIRTYSAALAAVAAATAVADVLAAPPLAPDDYKRAAAARIQERNVDALFDGAPPPVLRSIVVLSIRVDAAGRPLSVTVLRSNGQRALEQRAIASVRAAAPFPAPPALRDGSARFVETWLFRDDGRFQIRSLAQVQAPLAGD